MGSQLKNIGMVIIASLSVKTRIKNPIAIILRIKKVSKIFENSVLEFIRYKKTKFF